VVWVGSGYLILGLPEEEGEAVFARIKEKFNPTRSLDGLEGEDLKESLIVRRCVPRA
jgi:hypothetical protein